MDTSFRVSYPCCILVVCTHVIQVVSYLPFYVIIFQKLLMSQCHTHTCIRTVSMSVHPRLWLRAMDYTWWMKKSSLWFGFDSLVLFDYLILWELLCPQYFHNIFTTNHKRLVVISFNLTPLLKLLFYPPITTCNNMLHTICCENFIDIAFLFIWRLQVGINLNYTNSFGLLWWVGINLHIIYSTE